jgi:hypothetical protein
MRYRADPSIPPSPPFQRGVGGISGGTSKVGVWLPNPYLARAI